MEKISQGYSFLLKNEEYSLDIIFNYQTPNGISYKGITIQKKNCEIKALNNENLNNLFNAKEILPNNYIESLANIGLISISGIVCFLYLSKNDVILLNDTDDNIFYKIKNLKYIPLNGNVKEFNKNEFDKDFEKFKNFFISENLFFSFCKYGNNILNHHIDISNNFVYNENYFRLFNDYFVSEYVTLLNKGFYNHFNIQQTLNDNIKCKIDIDIMIRNRINYDNNDNLIKIEDYQKEKESIKEIDIDIFSDRINKKINYHFYAYYNKQIPDYNLLYSLFTKDKDEAKALFISALDDNNNEKILNKEEFINVNEKMKDKYEIQFSNDCKKNNIKNFILSNYEKIKNIFIENKKELNDENNINNKLLIITCSNSNSIFNLIQETIHSIIKIFFTTYINEDSDKNKELLDKAKLNIDNYFNFVDEIICKRMMLFYKLKLPKIEYVSKEYINSLKNNQQIINIPIPKKTFSTFILTYNAAGMDEDKINSINFSKLLFPEKSKKYFESQKNENKFPLFYCVGLEEVVNLNPKNILLGGEKDKYDLWEEKITSELKSKCNYILLTKCNLVGILFFLFVKETEINKIKNIKSGKFKTGFHGQLGNKGSCYVEFEYDNKTYGFNHGHLAAGGKNKNNQKRKDNLIQILNYKSNKNEDEFYMKDFYFILGDLNFRVNNNINIIHNWLFNLKFSSPQPTNQENPKEKEIKKNIDINMEDTKENEENENIENIFYQIDENVFMKYFGSDYWKYDQLNIFKEDLMEYDIKEHNISFPPTYKYIKNTNNYNLLKREPAWTDRILFKENNLIKSIIYDRIELNYSDHKPVFAIFEINY
jgi:hypothetical protein